MMNSRHAIILARFLFPLTLGGNDSILMVRNQPGVDQLVYVLLDGSKQIPILL
jgi:hypothetical protein